MEANLQAIAQSRAILRRAEEIVAAQPFVPLSPASLDAGRVVFCAGAAIVVAGLEREGAAETVPEFVRRITDGGKAELYRTIRALDWNEAFCDAAIRANDALADGERKAGVRRMLSRLAAERPERLLARG